MSEREKAIQYFRSQGYSGLELLNKIEQWDKTNETSGGSIMAPAGGDIITPGENDLITENVNQGESIFSQYPPPTSTSPTTTTSLFPQADQIYSGSGISPGAQPSASSPQSLISIGILKNNEDDILEDYKKAYIYF